MPSIIVKKDFKFAEGGFDVIEYFAGSEAVEVSDECAEIAITEKWAIDAGKKAGKPVEKIQAQIIDEAFESQREALAVESAPEVA